MSDAKADILSLFTFTPHWLERANSRISPERPETFEHFYVVVSCDMYRARENAGAFEALNDPIDGRYGPHALAHILSERAREIAQEHPDGPLLILEGLTGQDRRLSLLCGGDDWHLNFRAGHIGEVLAFVAFPTKEKAARLAATA